MGQGAPKFSSRFLQKELVLKISSAANGGRGWAPRVGAPDRSSRFVVLGFDVPSCSDASHPYVARGDMERCDNSRTGSIST